MVVVVVVVVLRLLWVGPSVRFVFDSLVRARLLGKVPSVWSRSRSLPLGGRWGLEVLLVSVREKQCRGFQVRFLHRVG